MNLYELSTQYVDALKSLDDLDLPAEVISDTLEGLGGELMEKCKNVAAYQQNLLALAAAKKEAAKRLSEQAKQLENRAQSFIDYLDSNMQRAGITEIECPLFKIKYRKNTPSVLIEDESLIDKKFIKEKITTAPDKTAIKKAIQDGEVIEGASLQQGEKLVIV